MRALWLAAAALLAGCAALSSVTDEHQLKPGQGYLALQIEADTRGNLWYTDYSDSPGFGSRFVSAMGANRGGVHVSYGARYWLLAVDQGDYMWSRMELGTTHFVDLLGSSRFQVKANAITYIGHVRINAAASNRLRMQVRDDEAGMRAYLEKNNPLLLRTHGFEKQIARLGRESGAR